MALVILERGPKCLISHATGGCVGDRTPLQRFEGSTRLSRLRDRKGLTRLLNTVTHSFADNACWREKKEQLLKGSLVEIHQGMAYRECRLRPRIVYDWAASPTYPLHFHYRLFRKRLGLVLEGVTLVVS